MKSCASEFRLVDRGFRDTLVLIPGWATDCRIFDNLDLDYNYLLPFNFSPFNFKKALLEELKKTGAGKISLFGCSLGGFLAASFCAQNADMIDELILAGIRKRYDSPALEQVKVRLKKNKQAFLREFYFSCFSAEDKDGLAWFKKHLLDNYITEADLDYLIEGLDYLAQAEIDPESLAGLKKIRIFHGRDDEIAPFSEAIEIKSRLPRAEFIPLEGTGHLIFLNPRFRGSFTPPLSNRAGL